MQSSQKMSDPGMDASAKVTKLVGLVSLAGHAKGTGNLKSARNSSHNSLQIAN